MPMDRETVVAYLDRIGVTAPAACDAAGLRTLHRAHQLTVPFENLSIHLAEPISLNERDLADKIVRSRRGGFYDAISKIRPEAEGTDEVKWNFTKFLIGRDGEVIKRYEPPVLPADIKADLEHYL